MTGHIQKICKCHFQNKTRAQVFLNEKIWKSQGKSDKGVKPSSWVFDKIKIYKDRFYELCHPINILNYFGCIMGE